MKKTSKKITAILMIIVMIVVNAPISVFAADTTRPSVAISGPSNSTRYVGESVSYTVTFSDNEPGLKVNMTSAHVILNGFVGNIAVTGSGNTRTVTISNIQGSVGPDKTIYIREGAANDAEGNFTRATPNSIEFNILAAVDSTRPSISLSAPSHKTRYAGETVSYTVTFTDNKGIVSVPMNASSISLNGFTGNISVTGSGMYSRTVTISNIRGTVGANKTIYIRAGAAVDAEGNYTRATPNSIDFAIVTKTVAAKPVKPIIKPIVNKPYTPPFIQNNYVGACVEAYPPQNCEDFIGQMGDINSEITYLSSWLRAEKYTSQYVQENNYVAKDETMTYMVEYYNGSTAPMPSVNFEINIPHAVVIEEINNKGQITLKTETETRILWNVGQLATGARCRLYVKVKFTGDSRIENSNDISREFYVGLKTTAEGNSSYSYIRQLYIDKNPNKVGEFKKYLTTVDSKNEIRPDDQMTRAEFAKILVDSGIIKAVAGSEEYKTFKDAEKIPAFARDAVSALVGKDIIQGYNDGEFKPNNPMLREDMFQMIAQASRYMSDTKLTIVKPTYLYTAALTGTDKKVSEKKDYIMELMRQNIVVKTDSRPDEYAKRKEVVEIINNLTFRGPFVERLPSNTFKYSDAREDSNYFYNMVSATNSYKYKYDYRLWQETTQII